jgi:fructoselysine-6-P-deglycase FrlB-like protein
MATEMATQPDNWIDAVRLARAHAAALPQPGERVAVLGCGSSFHVARAVARLRESLGLGETDAWPGGDPVLQRPYDRVVAISRSGTTTEILHALEGLADRVPVTVVTADTATPIVELGEVIAMDHVDEQAVVQTRTATTTVAMFRWHLGQDLTQVAEQARQVLAIDEEELASTTLADVRHAEQLVFVGMGWTYGLAEEASLKLKESTQSWTESYHQTEFRHGPISNSAPGRAVWALGPLIPDFARDVTATGAALVANDRDALAELVLVQRLCLLRAADRGLDPGRPPNLTRSIILDS